MINPFEVYREIKARNAIPLTELELETVVPKNTEWSEKTECISAILLLAHKPDILVDLVLFGHFCKSIFGTMTDFEELEIPEVEDINTALEFIKYVSTDSKIEYYQMSEDVKSFIAICCLEDGLYYVKNNLAVLQDKILEIARSSYSEISKDELDACEKLWEQRKSISLDDLPEDNNLDYQILYNKLIQTHTDIFKNVSFTEETVQKSKM